MSFESVGIIGFGAFGQFLAGELLRVFDEVLVTDVSQGVETSEGIEFASLEEVAKADVVFLAIPFKSFDEVLPQLASNVQPETTVVDTCSVKVQPLAAIQKHLSGKAKIVGSHPLFGPQSKDEQDKTVVVCQADDSDEEVVRLYEELGWNVKKLDADEHDKQMATVHGLTFFVSQALLDMNLSEPQLPTGFYSYLQKLMELQANHSDALTETIESYNPYAAEKRAEFLDVARKLDEQYRTNE